MFNNKNSAISNPMRSLSGSRFWRSKPSATNTVGLEVPPRGSPKRTSFNWADAVFMVVEVLGLDIVTTGLARSSDMADHGDDRDPTHLPSPRRTELQNDGKSCQVRPEMSTGQRIVLPTERSSGHHLTGL